jgi:diaminopropionate ammonia-lyase
MAGLDCAEVSSAAWPDLQRVHGTITVSDDEAREAMRELAGHGLRIGDCGAAPLAALRKSSLHGRILLIATEGVTDPAAYRAIL